MQNRFITGINRLNNLAKKMIPVSIVYHKLDGDVDTSIPLTVYVGNTLFKIEDRDGQRMEWGDRDYLIPVVDLNVADVLFQPAKGHYIEEVLDNVTVIFELSAPSNEPVWRWSDPEHITYRIHTKRMNHAV